MTEAKKTCFIIGSGQSMLDLSSRELQLLNKHTQTLALNKFLLFHKKINLVPKFCFLADRHYPAQFVFFESLRIARKLGSEIRFFVNEYYRETLVFPGRNFKTALERRKQVYAENGYWMPFLSSYKNIEYFKNDQCSDPRSFYWAETLQEKLFFYRGSLTTAINLAAIVFPGSDICLVGVDLKELSPFFEQEIKKVHRLHNGLNEGTLRKHKMAQDAGIHLTALEYNGTPGVQAVLPRVVSHLQERGVDLVSANCNSLLVEEKICSYRSIEDCL